MTQVLLGEYEHMLDEKGRLTLPARFRSAFAEGAVITRGLEGCLYVYPQGEWERVVTERLLPLDPLSRPGRQLQRYFFASAAPDQLDKQGRIRIPVGLLKRAHVSKFVVVAGVNDHLEVWDDRAWRRELARVEGSAEEVADRLAG